MFCIFPFIDAVIQIVDLFIGYRCYFVACYLYFLFGYIYLITSLDSAYTRVNLLERIDRNIEFLAMLYSVSFRFTVYVTYCKTDVVSDTCSSTGLSLYLLFEVFLLQNHHIVCWA